MYSTRGTSEHAVVWYAELIKQCHPKHSNQPLRIKDHFFYCTAPWQMKTVGFTALMWLQCYASPSCFFSFRGESHHQFTCIHIFLLFLITVKIRVKKYVKMMLVSHTTNLKLNCSSPRHFLDHRKTAVRLCCCNDYQRLHAWVTRIHMDHIEIKSKLPDLVVPSKQYYLHLSRFFKVTKSTQLAGH